VNGVLGGWALTSVFGTILMGLGRTLRSGNRQLHGRFFVPLINGSNQAIWQAKVAPDVQGACSPSAGLIAWFVTPLATQSPDRWLTSAGTRHAGWRSHSRLSHRWWNRAWVRDFVVIYLPGILGLLFMLVFYSIPTIAMPRPSCGLRCRRKCPRHYDDSGYSGLLEGHKPRFSSTSADNLCL